MATIAQVARQTRRGLFGLQGRDAARWRDSITRFQSARAALSRGIQNLDELANGLVDQREIENCYRGRERLAAQAAVMDSTATTIQAASKVMSLAGLDDVGLFGCLDMNRAAYPATCLALDTISARSEKLVNGLAGLGLFQATETFGGAVWEFLHPGTVQDEFIATGKAPPSQIDIMTGAAERMREEAAEGAVSLLGNFKTYAIIAGVVGVLILYGRVK